MTKQVLFTVGTEKFQMNRLINIAEKVAQIYPNLKIIVQYGSSTRPNEVAQAVQYLNEEEFNDLIISSDIIISHCGEGSLITLQEYHKPYMLVARRKKNKEHLDDHQNELATYLKEELIPIGENIEEIISFIEQPYFQPFEYRTELLQQSIRELIKNRKGELIYLVCSTGGHYRLMKEIRQLFIHNRIVWVTFSNKTIEKELDGENVIWAYSPTNRNIWNFVRNLFLACYKIIKENPQLIITTGAGLAVPFLIVGKLTRCPSIFIELLTRVKDVSLSVKILLKLQAIDFLVVQSKIIKNKYNFAIEIQKG